MTTAIEKYGIMPGARGRAGAAYYNDAARIVADSAARESQILASQSALALQSIGALGQSLSQGFSSYLQYKQEIKAQSLEREMKLREADRLDTQTEALRLQAEDQHVSMLQQNQAKNLELAQKWQDFQNAPLMKKADAEALALMNEAMGAAGRIQAGAGVERPGDREMLAGVQDLLGSIAKKAVSLGSDPSKYQQMSAQLIPLVKDANSVTLSDGKTYARSAVLNASFTSYLGSVGLSEAETNPALTGDAVYQQKVAVAKEVLRDGGGVYFKSGTTTDEAWARLQEAMPELKTASPEEQARAKSVLASYKAMPKKALAEQQWDTRLKNASPAEQKAMTALQDANPGVSKLSLMERLQGPDVRTSAGAVSTLPGYLKEAPADQMSLTSNRVGGMGLLNAKAAAQGARLGMSSEGLRSRGLGTLGFTGETAIGKDPVSRFIAKTTATDEDIAGSLTHNEQAFVYTLAHAADEGNFQKVDDLMAWGSTYKRELGTFFEAGSATPSRFDLSLYSKVLDSVESQINRNSSPALLARFRAFKSSVALPYGPESTGDLAQVAAPASPLGVVTAPAVQP